MTTVESLTAPSLVVRGRYMIAPAPGQKAKAHTRVTNFAKKLEDGYSLTAWGKRMVLVGAAQRSDIIAAALAADGDKGVLDDLTEKAMDAAKANVRRDLGTALHTLCEQSDAGQTVEMPPQLQGDVDAYRRCIDALGATITRMEEVVVIPALGLAGRFDRLVTIGGRTYVLDIKTGADLSYSWASIAIQLACYAQAETIYHPDTQTHEPMLAVDQARGIVVHLPAGEGMAQSYWVDLDTGRRGIRLTQQILEFRKTKSIATPVAGIDELRTHVVNRVRAIVDAGHAGQLAGVWPEDLPTLRSEHEHTEEELDAILQLCTTVEALQRMPFPADSDPRCTNQTTASKGKKGSK